MNKEGYLITLGALMRAKNKQAIERLQREYSRGIETEDFVQYMDRLIENSRYNRSEIAQRAGLSRDYCFKMLRGDKRTTERDYLLAICLAMKLSFYETQKALQLYPFPQLDETDNRSALIIAAINNGYSLDDANEFLEGQGFELIKNSPDMPSARIIPHRSTIDDHNALYSEPERGQEPLDRKGDKTMKTNNNEEIRVEYEQMGCMPCDMGYTAEMITDEFGERVYVYASFGHFGEVFGVSKVSTFSDAEAFEEDVSIEEYDNLRDAMLESKYALYFAKMDKRVDEVIAEKRGMKDNE